jgi:DHA3 family tetracycline resistance protein-like MFS transporter
MFPARSVYLATSFIWGLLFWMMVTVFMVYQVEVVRLDPLQLVLVGTALEVSAFIFEVPTGIVADTYSRRLSVVVGYFITGLGFLLMGLVPTFLALVTASFLWGSVGPLYPVHIKRGSRMKLARLKLLRPISLVRG